MYFRVSRHFTDFCEHFENHEIRFFGKMFATSSSMDSFDLKKINIIKQPNFAYKLLSKSINRCNFSDFNNNNASTLTIL